MQLQVLETRCEWRAEDVADPAAWTEVLTAAEIAEVDAALAHARAVSADLLDIEKTDFPLPTLSGRLKAIERELMDGRGFVLIRGLPRERWSNDDMCLAYWGIGAHLGRPWPQNHHGHLLGDVTDQGKAPGDPTARGNELGQVGLDFHCDGSDLVGLMCLQTGAGGGASAVCNSVALHNNLVRERPDLAAELYKPQPYDLRGEQAPGAKRWYQLPVFTNLERASVRPPDRRLHPRLPAPPRRAQAHPRRPRGPGMDADARPERGFQRGHGFPARRHAVHQQLPRAARPLALRGRPRRRQGAPSQAPVAGDRGAPRSPTLFPQQHLQPLGRETGDQPAGRGATSALRVFRSIT